MASGTSKYRYKSDKGNIFFARTDNDPALAPIRGTEPTGAITESITFKVSKTNLEVGCNPRHAILKLEGSGTKDPKLPECIITPNSVTKHVVILSPDVVVTVGQKITTSNGRKWIVSGTSNEKMR
jgi:hypothetical protein